MKAKTIGYWVTTALVALAFLAGGAGDLSRGPDMLAGMAHLGYPAYLLVLLGVWKMLGGVVLLAPGLPTLKEWAYAGIVFDLTGASFSHAASGDGAKEILIPLVIGALAMASWALRPAGRTHRVLGGEAETASKAGAPSKAVAA